MLRLWDFVWCYKFCYFTKLRKRWLRNNSVFAENNLDKDKIRSKTVRQEARRLSICALTHFTFILLSNSCPVYVHMFPPLSLLKLVLFLCKVKIWRFQWKPAWKAWGCESCLTSLLSLLSLTGPSWSFLVLSQFLVTLPVLTYPYWALLSLT